MVKCPECGKEFTPTKKQRYRLETRPHNNVFCSMECSIKFRNIIVKGEKKLKRCSNCGKRFKLSSNQRHKVALNSKARVGCSPECTNKIKTTPKPKEVPTPKKAEKKSLKPTIAPWTPYGGAGSSDFPAQYNPF